LIGYSIFAQHFKQLGNDALFPISYLWPTAPVYVQKFELFYFRYIQAFSSQNLGSLLLDGFDNDRVSFSWTILFSLTAK
jgi:hypothetical protein